MLLVLRDQVVQLGKYLLMLHQFFRRVIEIGDRWSKVRA